MSEHKIKTFEDFKKEYVNARSEQRNELALYLENKLKENSNYTLLTVVNGGTAGKGSSNYNHAKTIEPFNLSNWKWVEVKTEGFSCVISLNMVDVDKNSAKFHALYDRVGLVVTFKTGDNSHNNYICTNIDLPLDDNKKEAIYNLVIDQYNFWNNCKI